MEDNLSGLIPSDVLASHAYWGHFRRKTTLYPEQALMLAVVADAIHCIQNNALTSRSQVWREAVEWILEKNSEQLFSFENICSVLGLDAGYLRKGILTSQGGGAAKLREGASQRARKKVGRSRRQKRAAA